MVSCRFTFTVIVPPGAVTALPLLPQNPIAQVQSVVDIPAPKGLERPLLFSMLRPSALASCSPSSCCR
jgi:hypothetical protein